MAPPRDFSADSPRPTVALRMLAGAVTVALVAAAALIVSEAMAEKAALRVCADPNNLPFSNRAGEGFENELARLLADDFHTKLEYTWLPQRRGFFRNTLKAGTCDVVMGVAVGQELVATTKPYYRSSYAFVVRRERALELRSLDDPRLRSLRVAVQLVGDDSANSPPVHAFSRRGIVNNLVGFSVLGDYADPARLGAPVQAVDAGAVDVAVVWGPVAAYFAGRARHPLEVTPIASTAPGDVPLSFEIAMGVRRQDQKLRERLDEFLMRRHAAVARLLAEHGIGSP